MSIQNLFDSVATIKKKYEDIGKITGENFNIFRILKIESSEVKTHSAFLKELLDPKGSHNCDDVFLQLFINQQREKNKNFPNFYKRLTDFVTPRSRVTVENHIGFKNDDETEGGRIDILIQDPNGNAIIIENKIYAIDQNKQLVRYNNAYKKAPIFYLTLHCDPPSDNTKGMLTEGDEYVCISYETDVINWLEACKEKTAGLPILRESIVQYIYLIKYLTNQTINNKMKQEIVELISKNGNYFSASLEISTSVNEAKRRLLVKFAEKLKLNLSGRKIGSKEIRIDIDERFGDETKGIYFCFDDADAEGVQLSFLSNLSQFYVEIYNENNIDRSKESSKKDIKKDSTNLNYYRQELAGIANNWGKIENVENAWWGDWLCRYHKLDIFFREPSNWVKIIEDDINDIIDEVSNDVIVLMEVLTRKTTSNNLANT